VSTKRLEVPIVAGAGVLVAAALLAVAFGSQNSLESQVDLPAVWNSSFSRADESAVMAEVTLHPNGGAELVQIPGGDVIDTDEGLCLRDSGERFTGEGTWRLETERTVRVEYDGGSVLLIADNERFASYSWASVSIFSCGEDWPLDLGLRG
jgi:hypothetical protein